MKQTDLTTLVQPQQKESAGNAPTTGVPSVPNMASLRRKLGPLARIQVEIDESHHAKEALKDLTEAKILAEKNVAQTVIKLAETQICASLVGSTMPTIGAQAVRVNTAIASVDQSLSNACQGETFTHITNRANNAALAHELHEAGSINQEEAEVLTNLAYEDANTDIQRSRERMQRAKEALAELGDYALNHIKSAKERLS